MGLEEDLESTDLVILDVETKKTDTFTGKDLFGVAIGIPTGLSIKPYYVMPEDLHKYKRRLSEVDIVAHNVLFDSEIMLQNDVPLNGFWWDTMVMAHLINENEMSYSLDTLAKRYLGRGKTPMKELEKAFGHWNDIPQGIMGPYAMNDIDITWGLFLYLRAKLAETEQEPVYKTYDKYLKALRWIQAQGIPIDWGMVHDRRVAAEAELDRIMYKELGYDPGKSAFLEHRLFNVLGLPVLSRTAKTQKPQIDVAILQRLRAGTRRSRPEVAAELNWILKYRQLQKANGNWYAGYERYKDSTGLLHPNFKPHGTATGRLSCEAPNLQQIPRDYQRVKAVFRNCPEQDEILYELDYSQIELRVAAYYSKLRGDPTMFNIYKEGEDVHTRTTELVGAFDQIANPKEARQVGKTGNFLWIYGGGAKTMSVQLFRQFGFRSTVEQCAEWTAAFNEAYPGFRECIHHSESLHRRLGYITMWNGRRRHIRERDSQNRILHRKAFNSRVQGGSGQLLAYALIRLHKAYESKAIRSRVCNTVHDSIWVLVPRDREAEEIAEMTRLMRITPEKHFHLPFEVDAKAMVQ